MKGKELTRISSLGQVVSLRDCLLSSTVAHLPVPSCFRFLSVLPSARDNQGFLWR